MVEAGKNVQGNVKDRISNIQNTIKSEAGVLRSLVDDIRKRGRDAEEPSYAKQHGIQGVRGGLFDIPIALIKGTVDNLATGVQGQAKITRRWTKR